jgi:hypothetical protein
LVRSPGSSAGTVLGHGTLRLVAGLEAGAPAGC